tara:strand:+ start:3273 stop:3689 length:417 start_codon:yes stop_codon:yes gene_type:complete
MKKSDKVFKNLQRFANDHQLILEPKGECGFGRPCVGFLSRSGNYVDYNPCDHKDYEPIKGFEDDRLYAPEGVNSYHKCDCLAVLVSGDNYDEGLKQLNKWIEHIESLGKVEIESYKTGATGIQAVISGVIGWAIRIKK